MGIAGWEYALDRAQNRMQGDGRTAGADLVLLTPLIFLPKTR